MEMRVCRERKRKCMEMRVYSIWKRSYPTDNRIVRGKMCLARFTSEDSFRV